MNGPWERNDDRYWYDCGYALGVVETQRDAAIPRVIGALSLFGITVWDPVVAGAFLGLYVLWTLMDWRNRRDEAAHKRDVHDPGPEFEGMRRDGPPDLSAFGDNGGGSE